ncbi:hypothetical protein [Litoreibacter roseus]|uniref:Uncharacterized protein n=1 Tax=Litoreibacter roseus TaxID=2601869 RepID=A0A6N6JJQ1_9RHOB|nr:hypothetical protein [Litoreibacter roseus]GFE66080.1 hypothetical protein KIN_31540 [Litoreibacter roseus]
MLADTVSAIRCVLALFLCVSVLKLGPKDMRASYVLAMILFLTSVPPYAELRGM